MCKIFTLKVKIRIINEPSGKIGSRASCGSGYLIFLYVLTAIFLRFLKAYSLKNLKNKVSNFFFGFYAYTIQYCSWKNITNHKKYLGIKSPFHFVISRRQQPITTTDFQTIPINSLVMEVP